MQSVKDNADVTVEAPAETESTEGTESAEPQEAVARCRDRNSKLSNKYPKRRPKRWGLEDSIMDMVNVRDLFRKQEEYVDQTVRSADGCEHP